MHSSIAIAHTHSSRYTSSIHSVHSSSYSSHSLRYSSHAQFKLYLKAYSHSSHTQPKLYSSHALSHSSHTRQALQSCAVPTRHKLYSSHALSYSSHTRQALQLIAHQPTNCTQLSFSAVLLARVKLQFSHRRIKLQLTRVKLYSCSSHMRHKPQLAGTKLRTILEHAHMHQYHTL